VPSPRIGSSDRQASGGLSTWGLSQEDQSQCELGTLQEGGVGRDNGRFCSTGTFPPHYRSPHLQGPSWDPHCLPGTRTHPGTTIQTCLEIPNIRTNNTCPFLLGGRIPGLSPFLPPSPGRTQPETVPFSRRPIGLSPFQFAEGQDTGLAPAWTTITPGRFHHQDSQGPVGLPPPT